MNSQILIFRISLTILLLTYSLIAQKNQGSIKGQITDQLDGLIVGVEVVLINVRGERKIEMTDRKGEYSFKNLADGKYVLQIRKEGFDNYENKDVEILNGNNLQISIVLNIETKVEDVEIPLTSDKPTTDPDENKDGVVLRGDDLEALPDDPEALETVLKLLAGSSGGPEGGQIYIDGMASRNVPPKSSISEIRINRNPFSAEFDRIGYGRIEILTKAGKTDFNGSVFYRFNDESLNARNPFAVERLPFQVRRYGGDVSGSFLNKRASYFIDIDRRAIDDNVIINANIVDELLRIRALNESYFTLQKAVFLSARSDFQLNAENTLSVRYGLTSKNSDNVGVGELVLSSQGYRVFETTNSLQVFQTSVINEKIINQFRFQYEKYGRENNGEQINPSIIVSDSFVGGNSPNAQGKYSDDRLEIGNDITLTKNFHTIRFGGRFRMIRLADFSPINFGGTIVYTGGIAPRLSNGEIVIDENGQPVLETITSIERYRRTLFFRQMGLSAGEIRQRGGGARQFSISGGNPETAVTQSDVSGFIQDDIKLRPNFNLSLGLRLESQTNIGKNLDLAPRLAFAWSTTTGKEKKRTTVIRGGLGLFYSRFSENLVLQSEKFDLNGIEQFIITDQNILDSFTGVPTFQDLSSTGQLLSLKKIAGNIRTPLIFQTAISLEQQLPYKSTLTLTYSNLKMSNALRSRNINAKESFAAERPDPNFGDIYQFESSGRFNSNRLSINFSKSIGRNSLGVRYNLNFAKSDTDSANTFPINQYDVTDEFGRSSLDTRHTLNLTGYFKIPFGITLTPIITAASGKPFNIILGQDLNGDSLFTERPAFANSSSTNVIITEFGTFDLSPTANFETIPRNYGTGSPFLSVSTGISKNLKFDNFSRSNGKSNGNESIASRFTLNLSARIWNLFNSNNQDVPIGNLTSSFFGKAVKTAGTYGKGDPLSGSRTIEFQIRLSF